MSMTSSLTAQDALLKSVVHIMQDLNPSRYLSVAGLCMLVYDHLLTLDDEVRFIWKAAWSTPKILFIIMRYMVPIFVFVHLFQISGTAVLSDTFCKVWLDLSVFMGIVTLGCGNFLVLLHLWNLWDRNTRLITWTLVLFAVTQIASLACGIVVLIGMTETAYFLPGLNVCAMHDKRNFGLVWIPGVAFEVIMFLTVVWNALQRPRYEDQAFSKVLYRDGFLYFLILFLLRLLNVCISYIAPLSLLYLGVFFIWCSTTLAVTRLILNLRKLVAHKAKVEERRPSVEIYSVHVVA